MDDKQKQLVKQPINGVEPMTLGLSVNRGLYLFHQEVSMRSDLIFGAMKNVPNRYLLTMLASKAARALHKPGTRVQDTANDVLVRFSLANPIASERSARKAPKSVLHPQVTHPVFPRKSEVLAFLSARETSNAQWEAANILGA